MPKDNMSKPLAVIAGVLILLGLALYASRTHAADSAPHQVREMHDEYKLYVRSPDIRDAGLQVEIAFGYNFTAKSPFYQNKGHDGGFAGPDDTFRATIKYVLPLSWRPTRCTAVQPFAAYTHISHASSGRPFNNKPEDYADLLELGTTIYFGCQR